MMHRTRKAANRIFTILLCLTVVDFTGQALAQSGTWETKDNITKDTGYSSPHIHMKWKPPNENLPEVEMFMKDYVMRLEFGPLKDDKIPGKIYLCLPDKEKSVVAGAFVAQVERARQPVKTTMKIVGLLIIVFALILTIWYVFFTQNPTKLNCILAIILCLSAVFVSLCLIFQDDLRLWIFKDIFTL